MYNFFSPDEAELKSVICKSLKGIDTVVSAQTIQTGWTNITMDVKGKNDDYIFRFPRNLFFARMMVKDCIFCQFLRGKVSLPVPDMKLKVSKGRPFSMHKKIKGESLLSRLDSLQPQEQEGIVDDLSRFLTELHSLSVDSMPKNIRESLSGFLDGLASVHKGNYNFNFHSSLRAMENDPKNLRIVHGDFHPGNVLIKDGHVSGIIDFSFAAVSDAHADLGRFMGRSNAALGIGLIDAYQKRSKTVCDLKKVQDVVDVFKYVEYKYVQYMQSNHPEIKIPLSVLQMSAVVGAQLENVRS